MKARAEAEEEFNPFFRLAGIGMAVIDVVTGRLQRVNPELCRRLGYDEAELLQLSWPQVVAPDDRERARAELDRFGRGETKVIQWECRSFAKDGSASWVEVIGTDLPSPDSGNRRVISILMDISERKRAEGLVHDADRRKEEYLAMLSEQGGRCAICRSPDPSSRTTRRLDVGG